MILKAMPKKLLRAAGAATVVAMGQDFTGIGNKQAHSQYQADFIYAR